MKRIVSTLAILMFAALTPLRAAELKLAVLFSDHVVLQRDKSVPVWGWADPGEKLTVAFAEQSKTATADASGKWLLKLDPLKTSSEPRSLVVQSEKPDRKLSVADVLVGEVWLGSGQSNMAMNVQRANDFEKEQAAADLPLIRMFKEDSKAAPSPQADGSGTWTICSPKTVGSYSATLYFFGRELHRELKVPIGLINSSVGGTPIESWIADEAQAQVPELNADRKQLTAEESAANLAQAKAIYEKALAKWQQQATKAKAAGEPAPRKPVDPLAQRERKGGSGGLFNGKIAPLIPYALRGALWYQGEANANSGKGLLYQFQLPTLVSDWRTRWGEDFPFAWVQLPNMQNRGEDWLLVREAELKTLRLPHTGMAIAIDIGESTNIHPKNKQEVGRRLSLWALGEVYGKKVSSTSGPLPAGHEVRGSEMVVSLTHCDGGLQAKGGELKGFVIAGEDRAWQPAIARIEDNKVVVSSPEVKKPVAVRYAWEAYPDCNLYNGAGLPASPFRTDDWLAPSVEAKTKK